MFSKACQYAIRATVYVARQSLEGGRASLAGISHEINSPMAFTAKILQQLVRSGIISSIRGNQGGFCISPEEMKAKMIAEIVEVMDGDAVYTDCGLGLKSCSATQPCPAHERFVRIRDELKEVLETTSVHSMAIGIKEGLTFLKR